MGCDIPKHDRHNAYRNFNPRIPYGMRLEVRIIIAIVRVISIHASRMGCDPSPSQCADSVCISIHASRMGCDCGRCRLRGFACHFNPRIPYGMRRDALDLLRLTHDFNPRIPYGMRPTRARTGPHSRYFNPRIPYGMRRASASYEFDSFGFQSTHPVWDATMYRPAHTLK